MIKLDLPEVRIRRTPTILKLLLPKGIVGITLYPKIYFSDEGLANLNDQIIQHELYHAKRQKEAGKVWFWKYTTSKSFRLDEEARAYAFGFCFLTKEENILQWAKIASEALAGKGYGKCSTHPGEALELISKYYLQFINGVV